jgi:hypothetical protein
MPCCLDETLSCDGGVGRAELDIAVPVEVNV